MLLVLETRSLLIVLPITLIFSQVFGYVRNDCFCGVANIQVRRITAGFLASKHKYPWMVALFNRHNVCHCGGALISDRHVLTASHCVSFNITRPDYWLDVYGKVKSNSIAKNFGMAMQFNRVYIHPKYKYGAQYDDYDLAILRFSRRFKRFSKTSLPICVPTHFHDYGGKTAVISGWGTTDPNVMRMSTDLREGMVTIYPQPKCPAATNLHRYFNPDSMMCAFSKMHVDTCQGDSGGPIFVQSRPDHYDVVGVSSFGETCGGKYAGVYAEISHSLPWIWQIINSTGVCPRRPF